MIQSKRFCRKQSNGGEALHSRHASWISAPQAGAMHVASASLFPAGVSSSLLRSTLICSVTPLLVQSSHLVLTSSIGLVTTAADSYSMVAIYDPGERTTRVLLRELGANPSSVESVLNDLQKSQGYLCPIFVPLLLVETIHQGVHRLLVEQSGKIRRANVIQRLSGYKCSDMHFSTIARVHGLDAIPGGSDLVDLAQQLSSMHQAAKHLQRSVEGGLEAATVLRRMHHRFLKGLDSLEREHITQSWNELLQRLSLTTQELRQRLIQVKDHQAEIQLSIQTVNGRNLVLLPGD